MNKKPSLTFVLDGASLLVGVTNTDGIFEPCGIIPADALEELSCVKDGKRHRFIPKDGTIQHIEEDKWYRSGVIERGN